MTAADLEEQASFWRRHLGVLIVGGFAVLLVVIVLLQLLEKGDVAEWLAEAPKEWAYVLCFLLVWFDAVIPIFPGETTLSAASTLAAEGDLELELVMLAGALGAIVGDSSLFWIARKSAARVQAHARQGAGESEGPRRLGRPRPLPGPLDRRRALRPRDALRRQRIHGALAIFPTAASSLGRSSAECCGRSTRARWPTRWQPRSLAFRSRRSSSPRSSPPLRWRRSSSLIGGGGEERRVLSRPK